MHLRPRLAILLFLTALCVPATLRADETPDQDRPSKEFDPIIDWPMYQDPSLRDAQSVKVFDPRLKDLWLEVIDHKGPDGKFSDDDRRRAANAIAKAHADGMPGLESTAPKLTAILGAPNINATVRLAMARTLIGLDARASANDILEQNKAGDIDMILLTDAALAAWNTQSAVPIWRERMRDANQFRAVRMSAIDALGTIKDESSFQDLMGLATSRTNDSGMHLTAARAASSCRGKESVVAVAGGFLKGSIDDRLVAASLLSTSSDEPSIGVLVKLAQDPEPAVATLAVTRLLETAPLAVKPIAATLLVNPDANVRFLTVKCVFVQNTPEAIAQVGPLLDDQTPQTRKFIRDRFIVLGNTPELSAAVRQAATTVLGADGWHGQEQAAFVLGKIGHKPASDRLFILLDSPKGEVALASACALRWLAIPENQPAYFAHVQKLVARLKVMNGPQAASAPPPPEVPPAKGARGTANTVDAAKTKVHVEAEARKQAKLKGEWLRLHEAVASQLLQHLGREHYAPAYGFMTSIVPKHSLDWAEVRAAAIWSLGLAHEGKPDNALVGEFAGRLSDVNPMDPEAMSVRRFSAVSLGRMKARGGQAALQRYYDEGKGLDVLSGACRWALIQITGVDIPVAEPTASKQTGWFIEPIEEKK